MNKDKKAFVNVSTDNNGIKLSKLKLAIKENIIVLSNEAVDALREIAIIVDENIKRMKGGDGDKN